MLIERLGLSGNRVLDTENHGGPDQAVHVYTQPDYGFWSAELGRELESVSVSLGQRFRLGGALLEVTFARIPCVTLAERMGDPGFVRKFRDAGRPGMYARVLWEGEVRAGDAAIPVNSVPDDAPTVLDNFEAFFANHNEVTS